MKRVPYRLSLLLSAVALLSACQPANDDNAAATQEPVAAESAVTDTIEQLAPLPGLEESVPLLTQKTRIAMQTTAGELLIDVYPEAAPNAAQRFVELVQSGFYDNTPVSRIVPGFVAQFGINWREGHRDWQDRNFNDDPTLFALERGTLAFAKAGPDTNSTQVFINYQQNNQLAVPQYNFTVFGKVVQGMEIVDSFLQVGDPGGGLDQGRLWVDGEAYLAEQAAQPSMIVSASVVGTTP
jgi:cyclophilin family peptidyl-prolyl cis-trans isomerase